MKFIEAINYINDLCRFGINLGLDRTKTLLSLAGDPDKKYYIVHVAGTNGKGSSSAMLKTALAKAGLKTGLYTSPHLHSYRERIQINNEQISEKRFAEETKKLKELIAENNKNFAENPTEFEFLTILAATYFAEEQVDVVIFETGMGGRLDSTNALETNLSIITNIGMDHTKILGNSVELIAKEKAAIIRHKGKVVLGIQEFSQGEKVLLEKIKTENATCKDAIKIKYDILTDQGDFQRVYLRDLKEEVLINLQGKHQIDNFLGVICAFEFLKQDFNINQKKFLEGLSDVEWPGRLEYIRYKERNLLLDGAHNTQGVRKLSNYINSKHSDKKIYCLLGILDDKDKSGILSEVYERSEKIVFSRPSGNRSEKWDRIPPLYKSKNNIIFVENNKDALLKLLDETNKEDLIVSFGSFYFISRIRELIKGEKF